MISVNKEAKKIVDQMVDNSDKLNIDVLEIENGTTILDCGIKARGGMQAGKLLSEICMGGLGEISFTQMSICECDGDDDRCCSRNFHAMNVVVDQPLIGCMASQYAGWSISVGKFFALGSGPARALALREKLFEDLKYKDESDVAILVLETSKAPEAEVAGYIAEKCGVESEDLYILVAPCASVAGSIQISARLVETGMHKMHEIGFDINSVVSGFGVCPIAPIAKNDLEAMGRTNDCILYGGRTWYNVNCEDEEIEKTIERVPSGSSKDYGMPFLDIFEKYDKDFYKIDPLLFSPADITINNMRTGNNFHAGSVNIDVLRKSLEV